MVTPKWSCHFRRVFSSLSQPFRTCVLVDNPLVWSVLNGQVDRRRGNLNWHQPDVASLQPDVASLMWSHLLSPSLLLIWCICLYDAWNSISDVVASHVQHTMANTTSTQRHWVAQKYTLIQIGLLCVWYHWRALTVDWTGHFIWNIFLRRLNCSLWQAGVRGGGK